MSEKYADVPVVFHMVVYGEAGNSCAGCVLQLVVIYTYLYLNKMSA